MTPLLIVLCVKILLTLIFVSLPFLLFSQQRINSILRIEGNSLGLYRIYGAAVTALLVGYAGAIHQLLNGIFPTEIIIMGIASNAGATIAMLRTGMYKDNQLLTAFFGFIAVFLVFSLLNPDLLS